MIYINSFKELQACEVKEQVHFTALLTNIVEKTKTDSKTGKSKGTYVRVYLRDEMDPLSFPLWTTALADALKQFKIDTVYEFVFTLNTFNGISLDRMISCTEITDDEVIKKFKSHLYKYLTDENYCFFKAAQSRLATSKYGPYLEYLYGDPRTNNKHSFTTPLYDSPVCYYDSYGSINRHDDYPGGYLNHIIGMLRQALYVKSQYLSGRCETSFDVDWTYILTATMLHDIGKPLTYAPVGPSLIEFHKDCRTDHNLMGVALLSEVHNNLANDKQLPYVDLQNLLYTISNHDNIDLVYKHKRVEDNIIALLDGLDATLVSISKL